MLFAPVLGGDGSQRAPGERFTVQDAVRARRRRLVRRPSARAARRLRLPCRAAERDTLAQRHARQHDRVRDGRRLLGLGARAQGLRLQVGRARDRQGRVGAARAGRRAGDRRSRDLSPAGAAAHRVRDVAREVPLRDRRSDHLPEPVALPARAVRRDRRARRPVRDERRQVGRRSGARPSACSASRAASTC